MATGPHPARWHRRRPPRLAPSVPSVLSVASVVLLAAHPSPADRDVRPGPRSRPDGAPGPSPRCASTLFRSKKCASIIDAPQTAAGRPRATGRGRPDSRRVLRGFRALTYREIRSGCQKRTRRRSAFFAGCGILFPLGFQPSKDGDMVCARGPLGAYLRQMTDRSEVGS